MLIDFGHSDGINWSYIGRILDASYCSSYTYSLCQCNNYDAASIFWPRKMEMLCNMMRMASVLLTLLLWVQVPRIYASGFLQYRTTCGTCEIRNSNDSDQKLFYINGRSVDQYIFCKALESYYMKHFLIEGYVTYQYCGFDISLDKSPSVAGRKLLQKGASKEGSTGHDLTTKELTIAIPVMFVLCCTLICPCFHARKKENAKSVLAKEPNSMDSISAMDMNSVPQKFPVSPLRVPPSPLRVPPSPLRVPTSPLRVPPSPLRVLPSPLRVPPSPSGFSISPQLDRNGSIHLNMNQVVKATRNFSPSLIIGQGRSGIVYKAQLPDGQVVAIKRAKKENFHAIQTEFRSEVELLSKIDHRCLVKLLGYIDEGNELLIITEFVPNGTLREHLDGLRREILDFKQRLEISIDVAHGLTYLHLFAEKQIIHRDVESSNILLNVSMRAKVADFGFARLGDMDSDRTHVSTEVKGTIGYLDPEYMRTSQLTPKSDVYSFGVLLLEILTGRRPVEAKRPAEERVTLRWAFGKYSEGNIDDLLDPLMNEAIDRQILMKMFGLAFECAAPTRDDRPNMKSVGEQLWGIRMDYLRSGTRE